MSKSVNVVKLKRRQKLIGDQDRIYSQRGPVQKKMWGPLHLCFPRKNWRLFFFFSHHCPRVSCQSSEKLTTFFCLSLSLIQGSRPLFRYFRHAKKSPLLLWGPLFVGAPVRPNMLNLPKSAAVGDVDHLKPVLLHCWVRLVRGRSQTNCFKEPQWQVGQTLKGVEFISTYGCSQSSSSSSTFFNETQLTNATVCTM